MSSKHSDNNKRDEPGNGWAWNINISKLPQLLSILYTRETSEASKHKFRPTSQWRKQAHQCFYNVVIHWNRNFDLLTNLFSLAEPESLYNFRCSHWSKFCPWWRHQMESFSVLLAICAGNSPVPGEFPTQRPVTRSFGVFFDLRLNKRLTKQSWGWWFEALSWPLWRHCNAIWHFRPSVTLFWCQSFRELFKITNCQSLNTSVIEYL